MTPAALTPFVHVATGLAVICAVVLVWVALRSRHPTPVLTYQAWASVVLAAFLTVYSGSILNVDFGFPVLDDPGTRIIVRLAAIALGLIPAVWLARYWLRRF